jgi:tetratricopeptide (TPR) repeat protein
VALPEACAIWLPAGVTAAQGAILEPLGVAYHERGNLKEAIVQYQKALQIYPDYVKHITI